MGNRECMPLLNIVQYVIPMKSNTFPKHKLRSRLVTRLNGYRGKPNILSRLSFLFFLFSMDVKITFLKAWFNQISEVRGFATKVSSLHKICIALNLLLQKFRYVEEVNFYQLLSSQLLSGIFVHTNLSRLKGF